MASTPDDEEEEERTAGIVLTADEWHFVIASLGAVTNNRFDSAERRNYAYRLQGKIVLGLLEKE